MATATGVIGVEVEPRVFPVCRHCGIRPVHKARGLCHRCWIVPGVRERYPARGKGGPHRAATGRDDAILVKVGKKLMPMDQYYGRARTPKQLKAMGWVPTTALPGTSDKVQVMQWRAARGLPLFHPDDGRYG
jgi:hypothetical protein